MTEKGEHMSGIFAHQTYTFDVALKWLREGTKVTRKAWQEDEFVVLQKGYPGGIAINSNTAEATGIPEGTVCLFRPYLMKAEALSNGFVPWTPSQVDVLAGDWIESRFPEPEGLDYREAMQLVLNGERLSRRAWANDSVYVYCTATRAVYRREADNWRGNYTASQTDKDATDWYITAWSE